MVSFGHAAYLGVGAYAVAILAVAGVHDGLLQWAVAIGASMLVALVDRRDLAAHQRHLLHHDHARVRADALLPRRSSLDAYGGDNGMTSADAQPVRRPDRSRQRERSSTTSCSRCWCCVVLLVRRAGRFALRHGASAPRKSNERAHRARIGFPTFRYQLAAFVIAGGDLRAGRRAAGQPHGLRHPGFHALDALGRHPVHGDPGRHRQLGRAGARRARAICVLENALSDWTEHWQIILGPLLVLVGAVRARAACCRAARRADGKRRWLSRCSRSDGLRKCFGALRATDRSRSTSTRARCTRSSAPTAPARRR